MTLNAHNPISLRTLFLQIVGVVIAYYVTGELGTFLAIQPGYATTVWPPSGIALAVILLFGYRVWPGIFIGSILVNYATNLAGGSSAFTTSSITIILAIAFAAVLQAIAGAYMVRRFAKFPNNLATEKEVFSFMFYGGALSTSINSTISVTALLALGQVSPDNFITNWLSWWVGDAIGVFIFAPLILIWMLRPVEAWQNRRFVISLAMTTTFALITAIMIYALNQEKRHIEFEFEKDSIAMGLSLEKSLSMHIGVLTSLKSYFLSSDDVNRAEFRTFVDQSLQDWRGVHALTWNPLIASSQRDAFEQAVRSEGYSNFHITELGSANQLIKAASRAQYVPALFIEPYAGNQQALGYDISSEPLRRKAMERARDTGDVAISSRVRVITGDANEFAHLVFMPVYRNGSSVRTVTERRHAIVGYAIEILHVGDVVKNAFKYTNPYRLSYRILDKGVLQENKIIYDNVEKNQPARRFRQQEFFGWDAFPSRSFDLQVAGRIWQFEIIPSQEYIAAQHSNSSIFILLVGLLLSSLVGSLVMILSGRDNVLQKLVKKRTFELQVSYDQLDKLSRQVPGVIYQFWQHLDGSFSFPYTSMGIKDVYELTPEQVKDDASIVFSMVHPDDFNGFEQSIKDSVRNMTLWRYEYRVNLPAKGVRWLLGQANPERLEDGSVLWHGYVMDITEQKQVEARLRMLSTAIEQSPASVVITNLNAEIEYANPRFAVVTGYSVAEAIGKNPRVLQSGLTDNQVYEEMWRKITRGQNWRGNFVNKRKNGEVYYEEAYISPVHDVDGVVRHYVAVKLDVSERKKLEDSLRSAAQYTRSLIESSLDPLVTVSTEGKITDVNAAAENITGVNRADLIGTDFAIYFTDPKRAREGYELVFSQGSVTNYMLAIQHASGIVTDVLYNASVYRDEKGDVLGVIAAARDVTDIKRMQEEMRQLAFYDPLTRLANRRLLIDRMDQVMAASKRSECYGALMFIDLDNFKPLNDTHGHEVGDLLLIEVAKRLKHCVRKTDTVARIGGDEFVVMLSKLENDKTKSIKHAGRIAEQIRTSIAEPYLLKVHSKQKLHSKEMSELTVEHRCSASIGVTMFQGDDLSQDEIMRRADDTMYQAKETGRNRVLFYEAE
jgi:diguanylate cyclase (GGDEF)-like protein/PAS domain S-box-containing protein